MNNENNAGIDLNSDDVIRELAVSAGLWPNTIDHWSPALRRYTDAILARRASATPSSKDAGSLTDDECDVAASRALMEIAIARGLSPTEVNTDTKAHWSWGRALVRAGFALAAPSEYQRGLEDAARLLEEKFSWSAARAPIGEACDAIRALKSAGATAKTEQLRARLPHALSVFHEHMPPGGLSSIGHANVGKALLAILSEPMLSAGAAAKTEQAPSAVRAQIEADATCILRLLDTVDKLMGSVSGATESIQEHAQHIIQFAGKIDAPARAAGAGSEQPAAADRDALAQQAAPKAPATAASASGPKLYRKTALVSAEQFLPEEGKIPDGVISDGHGDPRKSSNFSFVLDTKEGRHILRHGDYICTGPAGERWNVERSIFEATYELADRAPSRAADGQPGASRAVLDERAAFEAWGNELFNYGFEPAQRANGMDNAEYTHEGTQMAWEGWQARAALARAPLPEHAGEVEPDGWLFGNGFYERGNPRTTYQVRKHGRPMWGRAPLPGQDGQAVDDARDAARREAWLIANPRWSVRWRIHTKKQIEQWQMVDDGEPWGQWGEYRKVVDAAMSASRPDDKGGAA